MNSNISIDTNTFYIVFAQRVNIPEYSYPITVDMALKIGVVVKEMEKVPKVLATVTVLQLFPWIMVTAVSIG